MATSTILKQGDNGPAVRRLQTRLNLHGAAPRLVVDGDFGKKTHVQVIGFQRRAKLETDGIVGPVTHKALALSPADLAEAVKPTKPAPEPVGPPASIGKVYSRSAIGLRPAKSSGTAVSWSTASHPIVHYPATTERIMTVAQAKAALRSYQAYHMDFHGWRDIGYHVAVDRFGNIYMLRSKETRGAHTLDAKGKYADANSSPGILYLVANPEKPTQAAIDAVKRYCKMVGVDYDKIDIHASCDYTSCPGPLIARIHNRRYPR